MLLTVQNLLEFREFCDPIKLLKIERACVQLWKPLMHSDEQNVAELAISELVEDSVYANYFLAFLFCKLTTTSSNQLHIEHAGFVSLKDKFLKMLSSTFRIIIEIDSNDIRVSLVGIMIQVASRICFNSSAASLGSPNSGSAIMLLEHLDCPLLKEYRIWEIYFLYRINRNKSVLNVHNKNHFLCSIGCDSRPPRQQREANQISRPAIPTYRQDCERR